MTSDEPTGGPIRITRRYDVAAAVGTPGRHVIAAQLAVPRGHRAPVAVCCVPGGGMLGGYFDLLVPPAQEGADGTDRSYSFAEYATARGITVITVDNLGTGGSHSDRGVLQTPAAAAAAVGDAARQALRELRTGAVAPGGEPCDIRVSVGCGHSMGALLTLLAQATTRPHDSLALLGFTTAGLPDLVGPRERAMIGTPRRFGAEIVDLAVERFRSTDGTQAAPFPFHLDDTPPAARRALAASGTTVLPGPGLLSMVPGNAAEAAAAADVPVFIGVGDHEPWGARADELARQFPSSPAVTVQVLERAAHNHVLAGTRAAQWERLCRWALALAPAPR